MNLAYRDVRHSLFRFFLTCIGLSLLMAVVMAMMGIYNGAVIDALTISRAPKVDVWVVEADTKGPFAESSRIPGSTRVDALKSVSIEIRSGEVVALLGPSGSGKTTLLNAIGCIMEPSSGRIALDGDLVYDNAWLKSDLRRLRLDRIGFIFQFHNLLPFLNATDNVALVLELAGAEATEARKKAEQLLDYLEVGHRKGSMPGKLSGGEAQRVAIARALANSPRIILADEPTAALDSKRAGIVMDLLRKLAVENDACIIAVTHDEKIFDRFDRIFNLRDGQLEAD